MNFNKIVFQPPKPHYDKSFPFLYGIPKSNGETIPIIFYENLTDISKLMIFFHGNAEDALCSLMFIGKLCDDIQCHAIIVEYPGYGIYTEKGVSEKLMFEDALGVYDFAVKSLNFDPNQIIIFGRSLGSGPATFLASQRKCFYLILFAAFTNIQNVAKSKVSILSFFVKNRFRNDRNIKNVKNPIFFIHGKSDQVIPVNHSITLFEDSPTDQKFLITPPFMTHNTFNYSEDFLNNLMTFESKLERIPVEKTPKIFLLSKYKINKL